MHNFISFIKESESKIIKYYAFDWDDNIVNMPTVIHMEKLIDGDWVPTDVSTSEFAEVRGDKENWRLLSDPEKSFSEFRDTGPRGEVAFLEDLKHAIELGNYGPAWDDFIECLTTGSLFAIITARGHEPKAIRTGIEWLLDNVLSPDQMYDMYNHLMKFAYLFRDEEEFDRLLKGKPSENKLISKFLDSCDYVGVSAPSRGSDSASNPEKAKVNALLEFKTKVNDLCSQIGYKAMVGFSDDDLGNVKHIEDLVDSLTHEQFPNIIKYVVKGTNDPKNMTKTVRTMGPPKDTTLTETNQAPGLESSIMPFSSFNNMTTRLYPSGEKNRQDDFANRFQKKTEKLAKMSKELVKPVKKKKKK